MQKRDKKITIYLNTDHFNNLKLNAQQNGLPTATFIRHSLIKTGALEPST